jgi:hypothetical protein
MERSVKRNIKQVDFKGKRPKGSKRRGNKRIAYGDVLKQVMADVRTLKSYLNVEDKYLDTVFNAVAIPNSATYTLLNGLSLGTTANTREGQSVKAVDLQFNMTLTQSSVATQTFVRIVLLSDSQCNAAVPGATDVFADTTNIRSLRNVGYSERFHLYFDEIVALQIVNLNSWAVSRVITMGFHQAFNTGNAGTVADITRNSLYLLTFSNEATNTPLLGGYFRYSFVDN